MMAPPGPQKAPIELVRPSFYGMLVTYYSVFFAYALTVALLGAIALQHTTGYAFTLLWALLLGAGSLLAIVGIVLSIRLRNHWFEMVGAIVVISLMVGYAVAIALFALGPYGSPAFLSAFWLPVAVSVLPIWRVSVMASDGTLGRKRGQ